MAVTSGKGIDRFAHARVWLGVPLACLDSGDSKASPKDNATSMDMVSMYVNKTKF